MKVEEVKEVPKSKRTREGNILRVEIGKQMLLFSPGKIYKISTGVQGMEKKLKQKTLAAYRHAIIEESKILGISSKMHVREGDIYISVQR